MVELISRRAGPHLHVKLGEVAEEVRSARRILGDADEDGSRQVQRIGSEGNLYRPGELSLGQFRGRSLPPEVQIRGGYLHFETNAAAERYGEEVLGPIRDSLPPEQLHAVRKYTEWGYPFKFLRDADPPTARVEQQIEQWSKAQLVYKHLAPLTGERPVPTPALLHSLSIRSGLTDQQRRIITEILNSPEPQGKIDETWIDAFGFRRAEKFFEGDLTPEAVLRDAKLIERAVDRPLPDPVHATRELQDIDFLVDADGNRIGSRPITPELMESLRGVVQTESRFISTSLGANRASIDMDASKFANKELAEIEGIGKEEKKYQLDLDIPAGSHGLWIGTWSVYPDQRELILASETRYLVHEALPNYLGGYNIVGEVLPR
ncbi:ADP-ribosyltransferase [Nocardia thraciensis]